MPLPFVSIITNNDQRTLLFDVTEGSGSKNKSSSENGNQNKEEMSSHDQGSDSAQTDEISMRRTVDPPRISASAHPNLEWDPLSLPPCPRDNGHQVRAAPTRHHHAWQQQ
jgi:hypothetical protein